MRNDESLEWLDADPVGDLHTAKRRLLGSGREVIDLSMINPDIPPPRIVLDKLLEAAVRPANHRYAVARGIRKLRDAFALKYARVFGVSVSSESEVCVTMGSKDAIEHALMCLAGASGAERSGVLVGVPTYPTYLPAIRLAGMRPSFFRVSADEGAMLADIERVAQTERPRVLLLNFPHNPTGLSVTRSFYEKLAVIVERYDLFVLNDFVYGEMGYGQSPVSALSVAALRPRAAEVYSISKAYSVPGWRVGALVGAESLVHKLGLLKAHVDYGIFLPIQLAAASVLNGEENHPLAITALYRERSAILARELRRLQWSVAEPSAGCCLWAELPSALHSQGAQRVALRLLEELGVATLPEGAFDPRREGGAPRADRWIRFALVVPPPVILSVCRRLAEWCGAEQQQSLHTPERAPSSVTQE